MSCTVTAQQVKADLEYNFSFSAAAVGDVAVETVKWSNADVGSASLNILLGLKVNACHKIPASPWALFVVEVDASGVY